MDDRRHDLELRRAIDAVKDLQVRSALAVMQRRTAAYADRNWTRITWLAHRTFVILGVLAAMWLATSTVSGLLLAQNDRRNQQVHNLAVQFCDQSRTNRRTLEQSAKNVRIYLASPAGMAHTGLNEYIRKLSAPQLKKRLRIEVVPSACSRLR